jgi:hypothetical protein
MYSSADTVALNGAHTNEDVGMPRIRPSFPILPAAIVPWRFSGFCRFDSGITTNSRFRGVSRIARGLRAG